MWFLEIDLAALKEVKDTAARVPCRQKARAWRVPPWTRDVAVEGQIMPKDGSIKEAALSPPRTSCMRVMTRKVFPFIHPFTMSPYAVKTAASFTI